LKNIPMCMGIYKITSKLDGKVYVGGTKNLRKRKSGHFSTLKRKVHKNNELQRAYDIYGKENFVFEVLELVEDANNLNEKENYWTNELQSNVEGFGYNKRPVYVDTNLGIRYDEKQKKTISIGRKGKGTGKRYHSPETVKLKSEMCKAQNLEQYKTEETEIRRLKNLRGTICDVPILEIHKQAISIHNKGEQNGSAKLTEDKVLEILELLKIGKMSVVKIAELYDICHKVVYNIKAGKSWMHITQPFIKENGPLGKQRKQKSMQSKLTENQVIEIIDILRERKATHKQLAERYKVSKSHISLIARGAIWQHLPRNKQEKFINTYDDVLTYTDQETYIEEELIPFIPEINHDIIHKNIVT